MTKKDLVTKVSTEINVDKKICEAVINGTLDAIIEALKEGDKVSIIGFGNFEVKEVAARDGRNPLTGESIKIDACKKPSFSASKALKDALNDW